MIIEILWLISWPIYIAVSYFLIKFALKHFERKLEQEKNDAVLY